MKILVVTNSYGPRVDPRALRWTAICEAWASLGHEVHTIASPVQGCPRQEVRHGVHVHRVGGGWSASVARWLGRGQAAPPAGQGNKGGEGAGAGRTTAPVWLRRAARTVYDATWRQLYWPDSTWSWIWPAWRTGRRLLRQSTYDAVVTVSHPFSGHVVGLLMLAGRRDMLWLADSGDPFALATIETSNNGRLYGRLNRAVERRVVERSTHFSVTTEGTAAIYGDAFPGHRHKLSVIPPLLQPALLAGGAPAEARRTEPSIDLLFVGSFYKDIRRPDALLELLSTVVQRSPLLGEQLVLNVIGAEDVIADALQRYPALRNRVVLLGMRPHAAVVGAMRTATCLVNVGNTTTFQLPSKVIEYMATGRPILNIAPIANDSSAEVLRQYPAHLSWRVGDTASVDAVVDFLERSPADGVALADVHRISAQFAVSAVAGRYLDLLAAPSRSPRASH